MEKKAVAAQASLSSQMYKQQGADLRLEEAERKLRQLHEFEPIIGHHPRVVAVLKRVAQVANSDATVLIYGESGTGKELIARALHSSSSRRNKPFVPVSCGAFPESLLESELFGHIRGAFTGANANRPGWFESADGGTLFLDEVSEMSLSLQVKLLRVLQTGEYSRLGSREIRWCDVRLVAATNEDLRSLVDEGSFREDLYYRLNVIDVEIPPLRERRSDIKLLMEHFLTVFGEKYGKRELSLSPRAEAELVAHDYPGNVRELENAIERAVLLTETNRIEPLHLPRSMQTAVDAGGRRATPSKFQVAKRRVVARFECDYITECLRASNGNISRAARAAGINVKNFYVKMAKYRIDPGPYKHRRR